MYSTLTDQRHFTAIFAVVGLGLAYELVDDCESALHALHAIRPESGALDLFEGSILMSRRRYADATRVLEAAKVPAVLTMGLRSQLAYCYYLRGDSRWQALASEVLEGEADAVVDADSIRMMRLLREPDVVIREDEERVRSEEQAAFGAETSRGFAGIFVRV